MHFLAIQGLFRVKNPVTHLVWRRDYEILIFQQLDFR